MVDLVTDAARHAWSDPVRGPSGASARLVFEQILRHGPRPRSELATALDLSGATLTRVTRDMLRSGVLRELPPVNRERGRPQEPLDVEESRIRFVGVRVMTDALHGMVTTLRGTPCQEVSAPLVGTSPQDVQSAVTALVAPLLSQHAPVAGVGVSLGAQVRGDGQVLSSSMMGWDQPVPLQQGLTAGLGVRVTVRNDMMALLQGLMWFGIGRGFDSFVLLTVGAGVATGIVHRGQVLEGRGHRAGLTESLPTSTREGRHVRLADVASGRVLVAKGRDSGAIGPDGGLEDLIRASRAGHPAALAIGEEAAHALAVSAATLVGMLDPQALIFGGEALGVTDGHRDQFMELLHDRLPPQQRDIVLRRLPADVDEWTRGAAVTAVQRFAAGR